MESVDKIPIYLNYKRQNKFMGVIDYKSLCIAVIYMVAVGYIVAFIPIKTEYLIYIYISCVIPVLGLVFVNIGDESAIDVLTIIIKYMLSKKEYIKCEAEFEYLYKKKYAKFYIKDNL